MSTKKYCSMLKMTLRLLPLGVSILALVIAYQAKTTAEWVNAKQDNIIEKVLFKNL